MRILLVLPIIAALVLGYGYYHAASHGWLYVSLMDTSAKPYASNIRNAELRLLDGEGKLFASAKSDDKFGVVRLIHPEVGDCSAAENNASSSPAAREQWQNCFQTLSQWLIGWAEKIQSADVKFAGCDMRAVPATLRKSHGDWWLWWVPLPHVGGKPLTYFSLSINIDGANCAARAF